MWQDINYHPRFCLAPAGIYSETNCFVFASTNLWLLGVLNSPLIWWWLWRNTVHGKDEALRLKNIYTAKIPIAQPNKTLRGSAERLVSRLIEIQTTQHKTKHIVIDWLKIEFNIVKPTTRLQNFVNLDCDGFVEEIRKIRGRKFPLSAMGLKALREEFTRTVEPSLTLSVEALKLENELSDLVNKAYGLTPEEIGLMWATAPPRMPVPRPELQYKESTLVKIK